MTPGRWQLVGSFVGAVLFYAAAEGALGWSGTLNLAQLLLLLIPATVGGGIGRGIVWLWQVEGRRE